MDMKRLNVLRRLDELETANLHLQVMLKSVRLELEALKSGVTILHNAVSRPVVTPKPKAAPTKRKPYTTEALRKKRRDYARTYAAKKRAEKLAVLP